MIVTKAIALTTIVHVLFGQVTRVTKSIESLGNYNVVLLVSFNSTHVPLEIKRMHLKLRYFIGRQYQINHKACATVGFGSYNIENDHEKLLSILVDIHLSQKFNTPITRPTNMNYELYPTCLPFCSLPNIISVISYLPSQFSFLTENVLSMEQMAYFPYTTDRLEMSSGVRTINDDSTLDMDSDKVLRDIFHMKVSKILLLRLPSNNPLLTLFHRQMYWNLLKSHSRFCLFQYDLMDLVVDKIFDLIRFLDNNDVSLVIGWSDVESWQVLVKHCQTEPNRAWFWYLEAPLTLSSINKDFRHESTHLIRFHRLFAYQKLNQMFPYSTISQNVIFSHLNAILKDPWLNSGSEVIDLDNPHILGPNSSLRIELLESTILPLWWSQPYRVLCVATRQFYDKLMSLSNSVVVENLSYGLVYRFQDTTKVYLDKLTPRVRRLPSVKKCSPGFEPHKMEFNGTLANSLHFDWKCLPCPPKSVKSTYSSDACAVCNGYLIPNTKQTMCFDPYKDFYNTPDRNFGTILISFSDVVCSLISLLTLLCFVIRRNTPVVRATSFESSVICLGSYSFLLISLFALYLHKPTTTICHAQYFIPGICLLTCYVICLSKTQLILFIFHTRIRISQRQVRITKTINTFIWFVLVVIYILITLLVSLFYGFPAVQEELHEDQMLREIYCNNFPHFRATTIILLIVILTSGVQAFRARNLPKMFNESNRYLYSCFTIAVILLVYFPISAGQKNHINKSLVNCIVMMLLSFVDVVTHYCSQVYLLIFHSKENNAGEFRKIRMKAVEKNAEKVFAFRK